MSTELATLFETWLKLSCWPHWWQKCAVEGYSIPRELQNILGNLSELSHRPRKKYDSFPLKNIKILIPAPPPFSARPHFWCFNLQQHSFNLQQLVLNICSSYLKFAAPLFNLQQLYFICSDFILFAATLFYFQQGFLICGNFILFLLLLIWSMSLVGHRVGLRSVGVGFGWLVLFGWFRLV